MTTPQKLSKTFHQATIMLLLLTYSHHHASAQEETHDAHHYHPPLKASTAIIMILVTALVFILGCFCIYIRQRSEIRISRTLASTFVRMDKSQGLDSEAIKAFPTFEYSQVKNHKIGRRALECAICLCEFEDHDNLRLIPKCNHVFHVDCIDSWLESNATCPVCRADLVLQPGETYANLTFDSDEPVTTDVRPTTISPSRGIFRDGSRISWSTPMRFGRLFSRSHSTGHSLFQDGGDLERFTLVLPEEVRTELIKTTLKRTKSCQFDFPSMKSPKSGFKAEGSSRGVKGYNLYEFFNRDGRLNQWEFSVTPPFVRKSRSTRFRGSENSERGATSKRSLTKSTTMPVRCLFPEKESDGERSSDRLRYSSQV